MTVKSSNLESNTGPTNDMATAEQRIFDIASKSETRNTKLETPQVNVFAVHGVEPEVQAYAMAKYSRSALSMKESLKEISEQKAERFLNTFYFQYGHRSIADLAHIAFAIERLSILAAIAVADEQRWDGQERSTRYQNFKKSGFYTPDFDGNDEIRGLYTDTMQLLFAEYEVFSNELARYLSAQVPRPSEMDQAQYDRTMRARAFDISRYLLPLATNTSLGQIVNARTLETQISRLLSHTHSEIRRLGQLLKDAAQQPAWNINHAKWQELVEQISSVDSSLGKQAEAQLLRNVRVAPTLVKYANPNHYEIETRQALAQAVRELMKDSSVAPAPLVDLLEDEPLEVELATTLLYGNCHYGYRQLRQQVSALSAPQRDEIIDLGLRHRGKHDELLRHFSAGQSFHFDILMDIGGFRDMHRHRRCIQIEQGFTTAHGYDTPEELMPSGLLNRYNQIMQRAEQTIRQIATSNLSEAEQTAQYATPLAYRKRTLFKMDFAEALYISELRTTAAGHQSYRNVAYAMYEAVASRHPSLAKYFRVTDVHEPVDLLKR
jgi:thymidylate synthase ThyX